MERRRILVVAAALVAALGAVLVFMYVRGADTRAEDQFQTTDVLVATQAIQAGETVEAAQSAGKITKKAVTNNSLLPDYQTDLTGLTGKVALTTIYPASRSSPRSSAPAPRRPARCRSPTTRSRSRST